MDYEKWKEIFLETKKGNTDTFDEIETILEDKTRAIEELLAPVPGKKKLKYHKLEEFGGEEFKGGTYFQWPSDEQLLYKSGVSVVKKISINHSNTMKQIRLKCENGSDSDWLGPETAL